MIDRLQGMWIAFFLRCVFSLRYRVEIRGMETLRSLKKDKGILFLPNHTAYSEAVLLFSYLFPKFNVRSVPNEYMFRNFLLSPMIKATRAVRMPRRSSNRLILKKAGEALDQIADGLRKGEKFIYYPAGQTKATAKEFIGGSTGAYSLIQNVPEVNVVMVRTTGLWGSSFSRAMTQGAPPDLSASLLGTGLTLLKNFIFFSPRRKIVIEIESNPSDFPKGATRLELNRYLENWYNQYPDGKNRVEEEPLQLVSRSFWRQDLPNLPKPNRQTPINEVAPKTKSVIFEEIRRILESPDLKLEPNTHLSKDLGMDSLHMADITSFIAKTFDIRGLLREDFQTVQDLLEIAEKVRPVGSITQGSFSWPCEQGRPQPLLPNGKTLHEAFLRIVDRMGPFCAIGDDLLGLLSYKKLKKSVFILAQRLREIPEERVAILLPSSASALIAFLACQFAGKIPVMLNWTLGERYLEDMVQIAKVKTILSSWSFIDRLSHLNLENLSDRFLFLEDVRASLTIENKLKGIFLSKLPTSIVLRSIQSKEEDPSVILFTSGTESAPKAVPLSHKNILSNIKSGIEVLQEMMTNDQSVYSILPPYHVFGLISTALNSCLSGMKVAFYPDPTDSRALANGIERWQVTTIAAPPSFLAKLLSLGASHQLKSLRLLVSGSEKASEELWDSIQTLENRPILVEGYGMTEASGIVSVNIPHAPRKGVGRLCAGFALRTISPETGQLLPDGAIGEICLRGPSIFQGYLAPARSQFIEIEGENWFRSGDMGFIDPDRNVFISGRLKRFAKIGGEMISFGAIEEALKQHETLKNVPFAVCSDEQSGSVRLVLLITTSIEKATVNAILKNAGFSNLIKISRLKVLPNLPVTAIGKINYKLLEEYIC